MTAVHERMLRWQSPQRSRSHRITPTVPRASAAQRVPRPWLIMRKTGGQGGIRTRDRVAPIHTFQACAFSRSATCPQHAPERTRNSNSDAPGCLALCAFSRSATCPQHAPERTRNSNSDAPGCLALCAFSRSATCPQHAPERTRNSNHNSIQLTFCGHTSEGHAAPPWRYDRTCRQLQA